MKITNSYIFFRNIYSKESTNRSINYYINKLFQPLVIVSEPLSLIYRTKYKYEHKLYDNTFQVSYICRNVDDIHYLDIEVTGKRKTNIIKCLEDINKILFTNELRKDFIDVITFDSVSEYYCNKIYPRLNILERNLRKLLFNVYVLNFRDEYYYNIGKFENNIKSKSKKDIYKYKNIYEAHNKEQAKTISYLKNIFYNYELYELQQWLFDVSWTEFGEKNRQEFLNQNKDLSKISDSELRGFINNLSPKSDWERFFDDKVNISDIKTKVDALREYRNTIAHMKIYDYEQYSHTKELINELNGKFLRAIDITEKKDFRIKKNNETAKIICESLLKFQDFIKNLFKVNP